MATSKLNQSQIMAHLARGGMAEKADDVAAAGRHGDSRIMHISPEEEKALMYLSELQGRPLTRNPKTGGLEAFFWIPMLIGAAMSAYNAKRHGASGKQTAAAAVAGGVLGAMTGGTGGGLANAGQGAVQTAASEAGKQAVQNAAQEAAKQAATSSVTEGVKDAAVNQATTEGVSQGGLNALATEGTEQGLAGASSGAAPSMTAEQAGAAYAKNPSSYSGPFAEQGQQAYAAKMAESPWASKSFEQMSAGEKMAAMGRGVTTEQGMKTMGGYAASAMPIGSGLASFNDYLKEEEAARKDEKRYRYATSARNPRYQDFLATNPYYAAEGGEIPHAQLPSQMPMGPSDPHPPGVSGGLPPGFGLPPQISFIYPTAGQPGRSPNPMHPTAQPDGSTGELPHWSPYTYAYWNPELSGGHYPSPQHTTPWTGGPVAGQTGMTSGMVPEWFRNQMGGAQPHYATGGYVDTGDMYNAPATYDDYKQQQYEKKKEQDRQWWEDKRRAYNRHVLGAQQDKLIMGNDKFRDQFIRFDQNTQGSGGLGANQLDNFLGFGGVFAKGGEIPKVKAPVKLRGGDYVLTARATKAAPKHVIKKLGGKKIVGKGTGTSDEIPASIDGKMPAMVSNGETVIPREAAKAMGKPFMDKLNTPSKKRKKSLMPV